MTLRSLATPLMSVVIAATVMLGTAACSSGTTPEPATESDASPTETTEEATIEEATPPDCETDADRSSSLDAASVPDGLPDGFPGIGVPFYPDATLVVAQGDTGDLFILEYQSEHDPAAVNEYYATTLVENCWELLDTSVESDMTAHTAWLPGYSLVIAVGPDRIDNQKTSIHYTLRLQETP